jgi:hypothetical protein
LQHPSIYSGQFISVDKIGQPVAVLPTVLSINGVHERLTFFRGDFRAFRRTNGMGVRFRSSDSCNRRRYRGLAATPSPIQRRPWDALPMKASNA